MNRRHSLPAEVFALVEQSPATVLFDCGRPEAGAENHTQLFAEPLRVRAAWSPFEVADLFAEIESAVASGHTAAGFFTYECGNCFEPKANLPSPPAGQPLAWFGIYERGYRFDHASGTFPDGEPPQLARFRVADESPGEEPSVDAVFELSPEQYAERIAAIHEWIRAGDVYQLNFTAPYRLILHGSPASLYAKLRSRQPVQYGAFIHAQAGQRILSFSPELFFRVDTQDGKRRITTRPMKGTVARGRTTHEDRERAEWLRNDSKNRAENLMIVDLLRNDLGRLARFGTVRTENMFAVERYSTLWQMTSTVTGELRPEVGLSDIFRALFPCGSITGAPKVRAMQLLAQLEAQSRGVYTGAVGFFSPQRTVFNVAIRTLVMNENEGTMGVGSGIVIDSVADQEYSECQLKAQFLRPNKDLSLPWVTLNDSFLLIETMLWDGRFPLLDLHLDRLADSTEYFAFPFDRTQVKAAIEAKAQEFATGTPRKVRLLLNADGELSIGSELLEPGNSSTPARVRIAKDHANSADKWLYHKTTQRALYQMSYLHAQNKDFDDLLFLNERGEVTEGAISNIFVEKDGRMFTPPIECGLLPGVYRRHLLETRPEIEERVLTLEDLRNADAVYICNAVRGLRKAQINW
jgi:para-aminobenzoate synthetase/4-amino-4-deoxychorismate lyase